MGKGRVHGDLLDRTFEFAVATTAMVNDMPDGAVGWAPDRRRLRAGTSIGANIREADHALTDAAFINRRSIARKESSETQDWTERCRRAGILVASRTDPRCCEAEELMRILTTIVKRSQRRLTTGTVAP